MMVPGLESFQEINEITKDLRKMIKKIDKKTRFDIPISPLVGEMMERATMAYMTRGPSVFSSSSVPSSTSITPNRPARRLQKQNAVIQSIPSTAGTTQTNTPIVQSLPISTATTPPRGGRASQVKITKPITGTSGARTPPTPKTGSFTVVSSQPITPNSGALVPVLNQPVVTTPGSTTSTSGAQTPQIASGAQTPPQQPSTKTPEEHAQERAMQQLISLQNQQTAETDERLKLTQDISNKLAVFDENKGAYTLYDSTDVNDIFNNTTALEVLYRIAVDNKTATDDKAGKGWAQFKKDFAATGVTDIKNLYGGGTKSNKFTNFMKNIKVPHTKLETTLKTRFKKDLKAGGFKRVGGDSIVRADRKTTEKIINSVFAAREKARVTLSSQTPAPQPATQALPVSQFLPKPQAPAAAVVPAAPAPVSMEDIKTQVSGLSFDKLMAEYVKTVGGKLEDVKTGVARTLSEKMDTEEGIRKSMIEQIMQEINDQSSRKPKTIIDMS